MTEHRWLDDEEQHAWRAFLRAATAVDDALDRQLQRDAGMPHAYYQVLAMLSEVSRLEERGWVRRERHPTDRRGSLAVLTDDGWAAVQAAAPGHVAAVRAAVFDRLEPDQVSQLREISEALADQP